MLAYMYSRLYLIVQLLDDKNSVLLCNQPNKLHYGFCLSACTAFVVN